MAVKKRETKIRQSNRQRQSPRSAVRPPVPRSQPVAHALNRQAAAPIPPARTRGKPP